MAIIIKMIGDKPVYNKVDPTLEEQERALKIHRALQSLITKMEKTLEKRKKTKRRIDDKFAYQLGQELRRVICDELLSSEEEVWWIFKAIREIYSKSGAFLMRGKLRDDYEYMFKAANLSYEFFEKITWDGWRRLMDSSNIRRETRFIRWLEGKSNKASEIKRGFMRKFVKRLNGFLKNKDTSVLSDAELFEIYEKAWVLAHKDQHNNSTIEEEENANV
jgi:hypothetical protein